MSRILEALKQIEARRPAPAEPRSSAETVRWRNPRPQPQACERLAAANAPAESASAGKAPPEETLLDEAPVEEPLLDEASLDDAPGDEVPLEEAPGEEVSQDEALLDEVSSDEAPVVEAARDEAPAPPDEAPRDETPAGEPPAEETPPEARRVEQASRFLGGPSAARTRLLPAGGVESGSDAACDGPPRAPAALSHPTELLNQAQDEEQETVADDPPHDEPHVEAATREPSLEDEARRLLDAPVEGRDPGFRALAANILALLPARRSAVVLLTSPRDGEGKTATLAPLAALLAERLSGGVLAVDCNLDRPQLADQFGVAARLGLRAVLRGDVPWQEAVRATDLQGLRILPALPPGPGEDRPADLAALVPLLEELRHHYRLVLLDAASLAHPGPASLARACDGTCLIVRLGRTTSRQANEAVRAIQKVGGRLLGCIVRSSQQRAAGNG